MNKADIIVIGAGASGLMAAYTLAKAGKKVIVLEARNRTGGRIYTLNSPAFFNKVELGAEFVHGDLPVTLSLLHEAGIPYSPAGGDMWRYKNGRFTQEDEQVEGWDKLMDQLDDLSENISINTFLERYFSEEKYDRLKQRVRQFVAGYDTADPDKASAYALREEWQNEDEGAQHRPDNGYGEMISYLVKQVETNGSEVLVNAQVNTVHHTLNEVKVTTTVGETYLSTQVVVALPLGVLQLPGNTDGFIDFQPAIPKHQQAIQQMGFGAIIKVLLSFKQPFWEHHSGEDMSEMGFLFSDEKIPTWWTQAPEHQPVLTGWLGGPAAQNLVNVPDNELLDIALQSLSNIYQVSKQDLEKQLMGSYIANWTADPYARGSYAYDTVDASDARKVLHQPVNNKLYFAGEYLYQGPSMGTVEAALTSGKDVAAKILY